MSEAIKPTPGEWSAHYSGEMEYPFWSIRAPINSVRSSFEIARVNGNVDANLIVEAGTVHHETGLTPRQLVERVKELEEAARPFANYACSPPGHCDCHNCKARDLLSKALPNTVAEVK